MQRLGGRTSVWLCRAVNPRDEVQHRMFRIGTRKHGRVRGPNGVAELSELKGIIVELHARARNRCGLMLGIVTLALPFTADAALARGGGDLSVHANVHSGDRSARSSYRGSGGASLGGGGLLGRRRNGRLGRCCASRRLLATTSTLPVLTVLAALELPRFLIWKSCPTNRLSAVRLIAILVALTPFAFITTGSTQFSPPSPASVSSSMNTSSTSARSHESTSAQVERYIGPLHTQLGITSVEQAQWKQFAQVIRDNAARTASTLHNADA